MYLIVRIHVLWLTEHVGHMLVKFAQDNRATNGIISLIMNHAQRMPTPYEERLVILLVTMVDDSPAFYYPLKLHMIPLSACLHA